MADLTPEGQRIVEDAAQRYSVSADAVRAVLEALVASGGGMAQFNHPDLGGMGQWSSGGMIMIGDMFNNGLKSRIAALCAELSEVVGRTDIISYRPPSSQWQSQGDSGSMPLPASSFFVSGNDRGGSGGNWWRSDLGMPGSTGAQNNPRYACFPDRRRLALDVNGRVSVYDTGDHWITGFSQQQGGDQSLTFTSQHGIVRLDSLPQVSGSGPVAGFDQGGSVPAPAPPPAWRATDQPVAETSQTASGDIFSSIERLAGLRDKGFISEEEFSAKKTELLKRL
jgi:Short C-terminal domain